MCVVMRASSSEISLRSTSTATSSSSRCRLNPARSPPSAAASGAPGSAARSRAAARPRRPLPRRAGRACACRIAASASPSRARIDLQLIEQRPDLLQHALGQRGQIVVRCCGSRPAMRRACAEPRSDPARPSGRIPSRACLKGVEIAGDQFAIVARLLLRRCDRRRASDPRGRAPDFLQHPAQLHLQRIQPEGRRNCSRESGDSRSSRSACRLS